LKILDAIRRAVHRFRERRSSGTKEGENGGNEPGLALLTLTALGVVYGDIGTSPLYAIRECFVGSFGVSPTDANVMGVLSLITWSLVIVISLKYLTFILRADNDGEGGILALMELVERAVKGPARRKASLVLGMFGAALLYGDGIITPAISVLSAIEGVEVATPRLKPYVIPLTLLVLLTLFVVQKLGTGGVGRLFGPVMLVWFLTLAGTGLASIWREPAILAAANPYFGVLFFARHGVGGLTILGIVFLVVTGAEALYADVGHFGTAPIRLGWYVLVLPSLLLNYYGQGALLLRARGGIESPFYQLVPSVALYPLVVLATVATVVASQAVISGAFSLTFQAAQLAYLPRMTIRHTSSARRGQIYVPVVNWALLVAAVALVLGFRRSGNLAAAYGVAITTTMVITTLLFYVAMTRVFRWRRSIALPVTVFFLVIDLAYFGANLVKVPDGGWVPLVVAGLIYFVMATWRKGRAAETRQTRGRTKPVREYLAELGGGYYRRVPGQAVYLSNNTAGTPHSLLQNLKHNRNLHREVVIYTARFLKKPYVGEDEHLKIDALRPDIHRVVAYYGFMQQPDVPGDLAEVNRRRKIGLDLGKIHYFVGGQVLLPEGRIDMSRFRARVYTLLARTQTRATRYFGLPRAQTFEIGTHVVM
jgi:KUP system potassium uptake protein